MGLRFGQLAGLIAFALVLGRLGRLLQTGPGVPSWNLILLASAFLGGIVWWLIKQVIRNRWLAIGLFALGGLVLFLRIIAPHTLLGGILPSGDTWVALGTIMDTALGQIRHGIPPINPSQGVIAILAILVWSVGALYSWGYTTGPAIAMVLPSIVLYLQFAIFDRAQAGLGWMIASALMLTMAVSALALERKRDVGRARDSEGRPKPAHALAAAIVMAGSVGVVAVATANNASGIVSEYGNVPWRGSGADYGFGGGGFRLDRFVELQQTLINRADIPVFRVAVGPNAPDLNNVYWTLERLDHFNGVSWFRSSNAGRLFEPGHGLSDLENAYQGTTTTWFHTVYNEALIGPVAPVGGVPIHIEPVNHEDAVDPRQFLYWEDSAISLPGELRGDEVYTIQAVHPEIAEDLGALATGPTGELSPIFVEAARDGDFDHVAGTAPSDITLSVEEIEALTQLPASLPRQVINRARSETAGALTDFERAWMLQHFFRDSGKFTYSIDVTTGQDSLSLDNWLNDPTSLNFREGYCEQFALSMAVLGRSLGIPSRVVLGFTPGVVDVTPGGVRFVEVRDINAHAWVEMFFEGFGWVQFDPTPRGETQPVSMTAGFTPQVPATPPGDLQAPTPDVSGFLEPGIEDGEFPTAQSGPRWWLMALIIIPSLVMVIPLTKRVRRRRRLRAVRNGDITAAWDELVDRLSDLGEPVQPSKTPIEFARETGSALVPVAVSYSSTLYGGREGQAQETDLYGMEAWVEDNYDGLRRIRAAINPRSLWKL